MLKNEIFDLNNSLCYIIGKASEIKYEGIISSSSSSSSRERKSEENFESNENNNNLDLICLTDEDNNGETDKKILNNV